MKGTYHTDHWQLSCKVLLSFVIGTLSIIVLVRISLGLSYVAITLAVVPMHFSTAVYSTIGRSSQILPFKESYSPGHKARESTCEC